MNIEAKQDGINFTCPMKITLVFLADNNKNTLQRLGFRRNALNSQIVVPSAPIDGEAVLFFQTQNINHDCNLTFDVAAGTIPGALDLNESHDSAVDSFGNDIPPELAMSVNPVAARQTGLR